MIKKTLLAMIVGAGTLSFLGAADIVALCIGNDDYVRDEDKLDTPVADAQLMKLALEALPGGADVKLLTDASRVDIVIALNELKERARGAKLALVFYSGHGMDGQPRGYQNEDTFLLPVEAVIPTEDHLAASAVGLREVLAALKDCPVTARAVILDCCRTGAPKATGALVAGGTKNFGQLDERVKVALGKAVVPEATLVAFAASPGRKAAAYLREQDSNSPFTAFLAKELGSGAGNFRDLVEAAAEKTELATERRQMPYVSYSGATSAIKQIVFRNTATADAETSLGNSAQMEALKAQLAAAEKAREEAERKAAMLPAPPAPSTGTTMPSPAPASVPLVPDNLTPHRSNTPPGEVTVMEVPPFTARYAVDPKAKSRKFPVLKLLSSKGNDIIDTNKWVQENGIESPFLRYDKWPSTLPVKAGSLKLEHAFRDESTGYAIYGEISLGGPLLTLWNPDFSALVAQFDFSNFRKAPKVAPGSEHEVNQETSFASVVDGVLYVSHAHGGYAENSMGMNGYVTAIDLATRKILWRSAPLVTNTENFFVMGDGIITGYGFTAEKDYLYVLDRHTGKTVTKTLLKSGPSHMDLIDGILHVRTYDTDYQFKVQ